MLRSAGDVDWNVRTMFVSKKIIFEFQLQLDWNVFYIKINYQRDTFESNVVCFNLYLPILLWNKEKEKLVVGDILRPSLDSHCNIYGPALPIWENMYCVCCLPISSSYISHVYSQTTAWSCFINRSWTLKKRATGNNYTTLKIQNQDWIVVILDSHRH